MRHYLKKYNKNWNENKIRKQMAFQFGTSPYIPCITHRNTIFLALEIDSIEQTNTTSDKHKALQSF